MFLNVRKSQNMNAGKFIVGQSHFRDTYWDKVTNKTNLFLF